MTARTESFKINNPDYQARQLVVKSGQGGLDIVSSCFDFRKSADANLLRKSLEESLREGLSSFDNLRWFNSDRGVVGVEAVHIGETQRLKLCARQIITAWATANGMEIIEQQREPIVKDAPVAYPFPGHTAA